jgi:hypothetical protein
MKPSATTITFSHCRWAMSRATGAEARVRYGMLLRMIGRNAEARIVFNELLLQMKRAPKYLREAQAEWLSIAEKQLLT